MTILIDSNVPMYLVGADHPHKVDARRLLETAIGAGERLVTDVEVLQEILHRYVAIDRRDAIQAACDAVLGVAGGVFAVTVADLERAKAIVMGKRRLSARDALYVALMEREGIEHVMSFDHGFDGLPGVTRLGA